jgi:hypothetical protein
MQTSAASTTPEQYIASLDEPRRGEIQQLHELIQREAPGLRTRMEAEIIAYGSYHYRYASGREGDWYPIGLSSRKQYISLYLTAGTPEHAYLAESAKARLPKADIGRSCIRIKRLSDVDVDVIAELVRQAAGDDGASFGPTDRSVASRAAG